MSEAGQGERAKQPVRTCSSSFPLSLTQFSRTGIAHQRPYACVRESRESSWGEEWTAGEVPALVVAVLTLRSALKPESEARVA